MRIGEYIWKILGLSSPSAESKVEPPADTTPSREETRNETHLPPPIPSALPAFSNFGELFIDTYEPVEQITNSTIAAVTSRWAASYVLTREQVEEILSSEDIKPEWKVVLASRRILALSNEGLTPQVSAEIREIAERAIPFARKYINSDGNNPSAIDYIKHATSEDFDEASFKHKTYCLSNAFLMYGLTPFENTDENLENYLDLLGRAFSNAKIIKSNHMMINKSLSFYMDLDRYNEPTSTFLGSVFHELEHSLIESKYGIISPYNDISASSIEEFVCDLSSFRHSTKVIAKNDSLIRENASNLRYEEKHRLVFEESEGYCVEQYGTSRGFLQSLFLAAEEQGIPLHELTDEAYIAAHRVLEQEYSEPCERQKDFVSFAEKFMGEMQEYLNSKGVSGKILLPSEPLSISLFRRNIDSILHPATLLLGMKREAGDPITDDDIQNAISNPNWVSAVPKAELVAI